MEINQDLISIENLMVAFNAVCFGLLLVAMAYWILLPFITTPFFASSAKEILTLFELGDVDAKDVVVDLGSGDGRVALAASRVCRRAVGIEINPFLTLFSRFMAVLSANGEVKFKNKSYWRENLSPYDVVYLYLSPPQLRKLQPKLEKELAPGTRVISNSYKLANWKAKKAVDNKYYLYVIGEHK